MGPRFERLPPQEKCVSIDRQTNNPVGGNIIIDALTFTYSAPERAPFGPKKKKHQHKTVSSSDLPTDSQQRRHQRPLSLRVATVRSGGR